MKYHMMLMSLLCLLFSSIVQADVLFDEYFVDKALRIDYYQTGDAKEETIAIDRLCEEPIWPGSKANLIFPFNYGRYVFKVYDVASNRLIFCKSFDCMFGEYKTTTPALNGSKKTFRRSLRMPMPKRPVLLSIELRDKYNLGHPIFRQTIDPLDYHIIRESMQSNDYIVTVMKNGDPHDKVDLVFLGEGYTREQQTKFETDVKKNVQYLFEIEPYQSHRTRFNIYAILSPSNESAVDEPRECVYRNTTLNASFNAFDLDRYLLTEEGIRIQEIAGQVPCDAVVILVNSPRYGGGGIFNDYCITTVDNERSKMVFLHELGHSFGGLADEYYASEVAYNEFYPPGVEPLEPNITALLDPSRVKWQDQLAPGIAVPTEYGKILRDSLSTERKKILKKRDQELQTAKGKNATEKELAKITERYGKLEGQIKKELEEVEERYASLNDKVGVFEGAGYATKGLYRPMIYCLMIHHPKNEFCLVCQMAISRIIDYYCGMNVDTKTQK